MNKETIEVMVEGGKATAGAQMGQSLGPLGVDIPKILAKINEKTSSFSGMKVPVKIIVNTSTKEFEISIGTPPISELIKKEIGVEKGAGEPDKNKIANLSIEQVIKIAKMKQDSMVINNFKSAVKSVVGSCNSMGVLVEGKSAKEINNKINAGKFDEEINSGKTELTQQKKIKLEQQLKDIQEKIKKEIEKAKAEEEAEKAKAKKIEEVAVEEAPKEEKKEEEEEKVEERREETKETKKEKKE